MDALRVLFRAHPEPVVRRAVGHMQSRVGQRDGCINWQDAHLERREDIAVHLDPQLLSLLCIAVPNAHNASLELLERRVEKKKLAAWPATLMPPLSLRSQEAHPSPTGAGIDALLYASYNRRRQMEVVHVSPNSNHR